MKNGNMNTREIMDNLNGNGGFDNFRHWNYKECTEWVMANYPCSKFVAENVAIQICD